MATIGSINDPNGTPNQLGTNNALLKQYTPMEVTVGSWEISGTAPDTCANNDQLRQESYVAEILNISGAPINVFKLLGVHEQGTGSIKDKATLLSSPSLPGYPVTNLNNSVSSWKSLQAGSLVAGSTYLGFDFGIKNLKTGTSEYAPEKQKWTKIGALVLTQANTHNEYAKQVKVEISDGELSASEALYSGVGNGTIQITRISELAQSCNIMFIFETVGKFSVLARLLDGSTKPLGYITPGIPFVSEFLNCTISVGTLPFAINDLFSVNLGYTWKRVGLYNLVQSPLPQTINLKNEILVKSVRIMPTLFSGSGNWTVTAFDVLDSAPTDINNIEDMFFNENRDRDYSKEPILIKAQYSPTDSISDLSKFGLNILDQYSFNVSFAAMVQKLGRPIVTGDIIEVTPEMQWDHNLKPVRKFLEVTDTGWSSDGYGTAWRPMVFRFSAQQAMSSEETRDIFGTLDTQKYLVADSVLTNGFGLQTDTTQLTVAEEIMKSASDAVPEIGSDDGRTTIGQPLPVALPPANEHGQPKAVLPNSPQGFRIEDGLPPNGEPYEEGYALPDATGSHDGDYFRLYYASETYIAPRLYRFSVMKNRWIFQETDRRGDYSSHKPSIRKILESNTKQSLGKKTT